MVLNCGVGEDSLSPLDCKEIQPVHPKGDQSWVFIGRTDVEAESPILWPPNVKSWLIGKDTDAGKDWGQEKGTTEDKMVGWHSLTQWSWVWVDSGSWWWTGRTAVLWFMGSRRVRHNWATELNWTEWMDDYINVWVYWWWSGLQIGSRSSVWSPSRLPPELQPKWSL